MEVSHESLYREQRGWLDGWLQPSPEERAILLETLLTIDQMLAGLGPKVRQAFLLAQIDGLDYATIAQELDVSVSSVKQYMRKAVLQCLKCL